MLSQVPVIVRETGSPWLRAGAMFLALTTGGWGEEKHSETVVRLDQAGSVYQLADWRKVAGSVLEVRQGATLKTGSASLGEADEPVRKIVVSDPKSVWAVGDHLTIGEDVAAELQLAEGARATVANWLTVGDRAEGRLRISGGATLRSNNWAQLGYGEKSAGQALLQGKNSHWDIGAALTVGEYGPARLVVADGATLSNGNWAAIGNYEHSRASVQVSGKGSSWTIGFTLSVGYAGHGCLAITDGATVSIGHFVEIGSHPTGVGAVLVSGKGSSLTIGNLAAIGERGDGALTVADGAAVHAKSRLEIGDGPGSGRVKLADYGRLTVDGPLSNDGAIELEAPGSLLRVNHDFTQGRRGRMTVWLGAGGSPALLHVTGNAELAGTLEIKKLPGATLKKGDAYVLLSAKSVHQWFDKVVVAPELKTLDVQVKYAPQEVAIQLGE